MKTTYFYVSREYRKRNQNFRTYDISVWQVMPDCSIRLLGTKTDSTNPAQMALEVIAEHNTIAGVDIKETKRLLTNAKSEGTITIEEISF